MQQQRVQEKKARNSNSCMANTQALLTPQIRKNIEVVPSEQQSMSEMKSTYSPSPTLNRSKVQIVPKNAVALQLSQNFHNKHRLLVSPTRKDANAISFDFDNTNLSLKKFDWIFQISTLFYSFFTL